MTSTGIPIMVCITSTFMGHASLPAEAPEDHDSDALYIGASDCLFSESASVNIEAGLSIYEVAQYAHSPHLRVQRISHRPHTIFISGPPLYLLHAALIL